MSQFWHDYWPVAAMTALTWAALTCLSGLVAFTVMAVREPGTVSKTVGGLRRIFTRK